MAKRKNKPLIDSDSSSECSDLDSQFLNLAKKKKKTGDSPPPLKSKAKSSDRSDSESDWDDDDDKKNSKSSSSSGSDSESDARSDTSKNKEQPVARKPSTDVSDDGRKRPEPKKPEIRKSTDSASSGKKKDTYSEPEEGEVSSHSSDNDSIDSEEEFDDGYDENLMGDEEDRARLAAMSEKEREQEIFKRIERRDMMKTRWEIERKLRLARRNAADRSASPGAIAKRREARKKRRALREQRQKEREREREREKEREKEKERERERQKQEAAVEEPTEPEKETDQTPPSPGEILDDSKDAEAAERSASPLFGAKAERKRNVDDRRQNAMAALRAQRDAKATRVENIKQKRKMEEEKNKDRDDDDDPDTEIIGGTSKQSVKLKASDIYSDDSGSESDDNKSQGRRSTTSSSSSGGEEEEKKREEVEIKYADTREQMNKIRLSSDAQDKALHQIRMERRLMQHHISSLPLDVQRELMDCERSAHLERMLLPDAPPRKHRKKKQSPDRVPCIMAEVPSPSISDPFYFVDVAAEIEIHEASTSKPSGTPVICAYDAAMEEWLRMTDACNSVDDEEIDCLNDSFFGLSDMRRDATTEPACVSDLTAFQAEVLKAVDADSDRALRDIVTEDCYSFNWTKDRQTFLGQRESFTEPSGPTFDVTDRTQPIDIFYKMFDVDFVDHLCKETNRYAAQRITSLREQNALPPYSRFNRWTHTNRDEMITFLTIIILQGLYPLPEEEAYFTLNSFGTMPYFAKIMTYNRFLLLKTMLHFVDNMNLKDTSRLRKIQAIVDYFNRKFSTLYMPSQEIAIDESLLKWRGKLSFAQKISSKAAKVGVKTYELCECATGYLWKCFVYSGKDKSSATTDSKEQIIVRPDIVTIANLDRLSTGISNERPTNVTSCKCFIYSGKGKSSATTNSKEPTIYRPDVVTIANPDRLSTGVSNKRTTDATSWECFVYSGKVESSATTDSKEQIIVTPDVMTIANPDRLSTGVSNEHTTNATSGECFLYSGKVESSATIDSKEQTIDTLDVVTISNPDRLSTGVSNERPTNATSKIVFDLIEPLLHRGHTLIMDNFYNTPLLLRCLKKQKTDCFGTLRLNREFVPDSVKTLTKTELRKGEVVATYCSDLSILVWRDANIVSMISTYHDLEIGTTDKYSKVTYKPRIVLDYNKTTGGVDRKDQFLSAHPMERTRNKVWYKKLFCRFYNSALFNCYVIFSSAHRKISHRQFRTVLAEDLLKRHRQIDLTTEPRLLNTRSTWTGQVMTTVRRKTKTQARMTVEHNHFPIRTGSKRTCCWMCPKKTRTVWKCEECNVNLCLNGCFKAYHKP